MFVDGQVYVGRSSLCTASASEHLGCYLVKANPQQNNFQVPTCSISGPLTSQSVIVVPVTAVCTVPTVGAILYYIAAREALHCKTTEISKLFFFFHSKYNVHILMSH